MDELLNSLLKIRENFTNGVKNIEYGNDTKRITVSSKEVLNFFNKEKIKFKETYFWGVVKGELIEIDGIEIRFEEHIGNKFL